MHRVPEALLEVVEELQETKLTEDPFYTTKWINKWINPDRLEVQYGTEWKTIECVWANHNKAIAYMEAVGAVYLRRTKKYRKITAGEAFQFDVYRLIGSIKECEEAMQKQQPLKPLKIDAEHGKGEKRYRCKYCENILAVNSLNSKYCHWCGQYIDWSVEEAE